MIQRNIPVLDSGTDSVLELSTSTRGDDVVLHVRGEVDSYSAPGLRGAIQKQIDAGRYRLIVDLSGVPFLDSSGLGVLVGGYKRARMHVGGRFAVVGADKRIMNVFRITGLVRVLPVYESIDAALEGDDQDLPTDLPSQSGAGTSLASILPLDGPNMPCDRETLLRLAAMGDIEALVERSLLCGSTAPRKTPSA